MKALELRLLPPLIVLACGALMALLSIGWPAYRVELPWHGVLSAACTLSGLALGIAGLVAFNRAKTTYHPVRLDKAACVVSSGIYHYSRNPMYLGMLLMLSGWAVWLSNPLAFLCLPGFIAYMNRFQIIPEERALSDKFGAEYQNYRQSVRRWI